MALPLNEVLSLIHAAAILVADKRRLCHSAVHMALIGLCGKQSVPVDCPSSGDPLVLQERILAAFREGMGNEKVGLTEAKQWLRRCDYDRGAKLALNFRAFVESSQLPWASGSVVVRSRRQLHSRPRVL